MAIRRVGFGVQNLATAVSAMVLGLTMSATANTPLSWPDGWSDAFGNEAGLDLGTQAGQTTVTGAGSGATGYTIVDRSFTMANNVVVRSMGVYSLVAGVGKAKIVNEDTTTQYDVLAEVSFTHTGTGWETFLLSTPYTTPGSGTIRAAVYFASGGQTTSLLSVARTYVAADATGNNYAFSAADTGWLWPVRYNHTSPTLNALYSASSDLYSPVLSGAAYWDDSNKSTGTVISNGGLTYTGAASTGYVSGTKGTIAAAKSTGLWYYEVLVTNMAVAMYIGISSNGNIAGAGDNTGYNEGYLYAATGNKGVLTTLSAYGSSYTTGDRIGVAVNFTTGKIWFSKNGTWQNSGNPAAGTGEAASGITGTKLPYIGGTGSAAGTVNFGATAFTYTPPSGFTGWAVPVRENMVLQSVLRAFPGGTAKAGRLLVGVVENEAVTVNTDFVAKLSRDGTTFKTLTLAYSHIDGSTKWYVANNVNLQSGAGTGSNVVVKLETANNKNIDISGYDVRLAA